MMNAAEMAKAVAGMDIDQRIATLKAIRAQNDIELAAKKAELAKQTARYNKFVGLNK